MSARLAALSLLLTACAIGGDDDATQGGSASVPTMPTGASAISAADSTSDADDDNGDGPITCPACPTTVPSTDPPPTTDEPPVTSDLSITATDTGDDPATSDVSTSGPPMTTADDTTGPDEPGCGACDTPPDVCHKAPGNCINGACDYPAAADGVPCDDGDECTKDDVCNGAGSCVSGSGMNCDPPPHATGGGCQNGQCAGFTCIDPYENCDGDWANGCEVPVGVPNQCDINGLSDTGCWTAYCGSSNNAKAHNFAGYYCFDCANCHVVGPNQVQWCNHSDGTWYPPDAGGCGMYEDLACGP